MAYRLELLGPAQRKLLEMSKAIVPSENFVCPAPAGKAYLPFQLAGIEYCVQPEIDAALIGDEPGLGKTVQAIGVCNILQAPKIIVACPAKLRGVWQTHFDAWLTYEPFLIRIVSYNFLSKAENVIKLKAEGPFDVGIFDEIHNLKNQQAKRTKHSLAKNGLVSVMKKKIALSGTPIQNTPIDLYPIAKVFAPQSIQGMDKLAFGIKFCKGWKTPWGQWDFSGASNMQELGIRFRSTFMVRRTKEKVLPELPAKFINLVYVEASAGEKLEVKKLDVLDTDTVIKGGGKSLVNDQVSTVRKNVGVSKIEFACEYIKEQLDSGHKKIIVYAHHKEVLDGLKKHFGGLGIHYATVVGGMPQDDVDSEVEAFQVDPQVRLFFGSLMACKEGFTLTAASYEIFVEFSWSATDNEQAMDRAHRIGQKNNVMVDFLVHKGSLDERIAKFNIEKAKAIKEFTA